MQDIIEITIPQDICSRRTDYQEKFIKMIDWVSEHNSEENFFRYVCKARDHYCFTTNDPKLATEFKLRFA